MEESKPWDEPTFEPPARPAAGPVDRMAALRRSITGKLNEATAKLAEAKGIDYQGALTQKLEEARQELGQSSAGLVAKGLVSGLQGAPSPAQPAAEPAPTPAGPTFSRQALLDDMELAEQEQQDASRQRIAFIVAYVKAPDSNPLFADRPLMYKIMTHERTFQQKLLAEANAALAQLPPPPSELGMSAEEVAADLRLVAQELRRNTLKKQASDAGTLQTQIFKLLQHLTGVKNAAGGVDFLPPEEAPVVAETASMAEALDIASLLLAKRKKPG